MMTELQERARLNSVMSPVVIGLPARDGGIVPGQGVVWLHEPKFVWIVPASLVMKIIVRISPDRWQAPFVAAIPEDGPLALRERPEWAPRYAQLSAELSCPKCSARSTRYRELAGALLCLACGRSFEHERT